MIIDSSAAVSVMLGEVGYEEIERKMQQAGLLSIGAPTLFETGLVMMKRRGEPGRVAVSLFREDLDIAVIPFGEAHREAAVEAFSRFGKGRHPAALNYGDCMTYATARVADRPLLFVGDDFARTDIEAA